jgi:hypothetical protein
MRVVRIAAAVIVTSSFSLTDTLRQWTTTDVVDTTEELSLVQHYLARTWPMVGRSTYHEKRYDNEEI